MSKFQEVDYHDLQLLNLLLKSDYAVYIYQYATKEKFLESLASDSQHDKASRQGYTFTIVSGDLFHRKTAALYLSNELFWRLIPRLDTNDVRSITAELQDDGCICHTING